ncbi:MAG: S24 family peptidase [Alphaproteobacteria bacterium]
MDSQWLKIQFQHNPNKSKADLARALGLEPPAVSKILAGTRQIKAHEYVKMRKFFGLHLENESRKPTNKSYILEPLHNLSEGQSQSGEWSIPASILTQKTDAPPEKIKIFKIEDTMMEPDFKKGEHVIVDLSQKQIDKDGIFILSDGFGYMLRNCEMLSQSKKGKIKISALQKNFEPQILSTSEIHIIGKVIGKMQWV